MIYLTSWYPQILISLGSCALACILASSHPHFLMFVLMFVCLSLHPHILMDSGILTFLYLQVHMPHLHPCILISSDSCVLPCILTSSHPQGHVCLLVFLHPHILVSSGLYVLASYAHILKSMSSLYKWIIVFSHLQVH